MTKKEKRPRSTAYPFINLEKAVDFLSQLYKDFGTTPFAREDGIERLGFEKTSGSAARSIAALVHYGLLERQANTYKVSELSRRILHPTDEAEKVAALKEAALMPKLFGDLFKAHDGKAIPGALNNILTRSYGILATYSNSVATIFKETMEFAQLLINGILGNTSEPSNPLVEEISSASHSTPNSTKKQFVLPEVEHDLYKIIFNKSKVEVGIPKHLVEKLVVDTSFAGLLASLRDKIDELTSDDTGSISL